MEEVYVLRSNLKKRVKKDYDKSVLGVYTDLNIAKNSLQNFMHSPFYNRNDYKNFYCEVHEMNKQQASPSYLIKLITVENTNFVNSII